jgi:hypothetical protein
MSSQFRFPFCSIESFGRWALSAGPWPVFTSCLLIWGAAPTAANPTFANAVTNGIVNIAGLTEASGVAASHNNPNVLWTHNDSGHPADVFAIDTQGRLLGTYAIPGNTDNEDVAIGPGPVTNVSYLYVGDIGDNAATRANIKVYQIPEPAVYARQYTNPVTRTMKGARTITLTYPDGARDAESLFVDPVTGDLFIATKETTSRLYTASKSQLDTNDTFTLTLVRTINFTVPSAADISPSGNEIIIRRENVADLWLRAPGQTISNALGGSAISIPVTGTANGEPNGEAIGFDAIGSGYFTLSDSASIQPLRYFARSSNDGPGPPPRELVSAGSVWKYLDDGNNQGTTWRNPGFDDSSWSTGAAQLGYGDGDEQTVVSFGTNANNKYITTYFRKTFLVDNAAVITNLVLKLVVDDGTTVYLNGTPVVYYHLATNASYNTIAAPEQPQDLEDTWFSFRVDPGVLLNGTNTLAVEVHQWSPTSSDLSFDLQLLADEAIPVYEPFDYPVGTPLVLVTNTGGQWWAAAGSGSAAAPVVAGNLTVPGLPAPQGAAMQFGAVDGPSARFNLVSNVTSGTLYFSTSIAVTSLGALSTGGGWLAGFNNSRGTQSTTPTNLATRILTRATGSGGFNIGTAKQTTDPAKFVWSSAVFSTNQTIFIVGSYQFNSSSLTDDGASLWINPNLAAFGADNPPAPTLTVTAGPDIGNSSPQIASFVLLQRGLNNTNQPDTVIADELRIGPTWASVTPPGPPALCITRSGSDLILSWPTNAHRFVLETTPTLNTTSLWTQFIRPTYLIGDQFVVTNGIAAGTSFYRLRK